MSDFDRLTDQAKTLLQIKLDGHIEACAHAALSLNIGIEEALRLTSASLVREFLARGFSRNTACEIFASAVDRTYPPPTLDARRRVS